ncbi:hypothetical protein [Rhizobium sp. LjRoot258]|uniref:hypothetical protein n=1 Tax=Rhizobium sp. LjRoot258 TaxID=3342299 RepID=UPI003F50665D
MKANNPVCGAWKPFSPGGIFMGSALQFNVKKAGTSLGADLFNLPQQLPVHPWSAVRNMMG